MATYEAEQAAGFPCSTCGKVWTGHRRCHCTSCHESFSSASAFDHHRLDFACRPPASRGLALIEGYWQWPQRQEGVALPWRGAVEAPDGVEAYQESLLPVVADVVAAEEV